MTNTQRIIGKLTSLRALVTLILTLTFCVQVFRGEIKGETLKDVLMVAYAFYFARSDRRVPRPEDEA